MRLSRCLAVAVVSLWANGNAVVVAFASPPPLSRVSRQVHSLSVSPVSTDSDLSLDAIGNMGFRELQNECKSRGLSSEGTTATLRLRIREAIIGGQPFSQQAEEEEEEAAAAAAAAAIQDKEQGKSEESANVSIVSGIKFTDQSDRDFDYKELVAEIRGKAAVGHWKAATRKLKKLRRAFPTNAIPDDVYLATLRACAADRLNGARAAIPARKIIEEMVDVGYSIPADVSNYCIQNCLGEGPNGTHDGFGGIDTALAMLAAVESSSPTTTDGKKDGVLTIDTYSKLVAAMAENGEIDESLVLLRSMVVDHAFTPTLEVFAQVAQTAAAQTQAEKAIAVLAYVKAAGYELDNIASTQDGRTILASGVIAAEKLDNLGLGLRLLTAASKASGCAPDRGDDLVASSSAAAQRASTLLHKRAIIAAVNDEGKWKLAVRLLETMMERSLKPSPWVWRNVVTCCAKAEKSRKATALLLDWTRLANKGEIGTPPVSVFNTVINACEICDEHDLTLDVLDAMKRTHDTEGNLITFNIALKRLAKEGNQIACEGIIIGMLQNKVEPSVVSYTTAIAACVQQEPKNPAYAYEWMKRMRFRKVMPNVLTYNTALAACLDGKLESTILGSKIAGEMMEDVSRQVQEGTTDDSVYTTVLPDQYSKGLARQLMKQLRENWRKGDINMQVAKATIRVPLLKLVDFQKSEAVQALKKQKEDAKQKEEDEAEATAQAEEELEYVATAASARRAAEV